MGKKWILAASMICLVLLFTARAFSENAGTGLLGGAGAENDSAEIADNDELVWTGTTYLDAHSVKKDVEGSHPADELIEGDKLVCTSNQLSLYYNEETSIFKVVDSRNGYVWSSGQQNEATEEMSKKWKNFAHCLVSADFITVSTMTTSTANPDFDSQKTTYLSNGFEVQLSFEKVDCSLVIRVTLENDRLTVEVPDDQIVIGDENIVLSKLYVVPFMGATMAGEGSGYLFIPDGSGALIRFGKSMSGTGMYAERIYGDDHSVSGIGAGNVSQSLLPTPEGKQISIPVFGMVHGEDQNALLYEVKSGAEYCEIVANPAGNNTDWYWIAPHFIYNELYNQQDNTNSGFIMKQSESNPVNAIVVISFLAGQDADYVGMAKRYRQSLIDGGELTPAQEKTGDIPLLLDCLMGESEDNGLYTAGVVLTTLSDLGRWNEILSEYKVENILYSLRGASKGGYSREKSDDFSLWSKVGSKRELEALSEAGLQLIWQKDMLMAFEDQVRNNTFSYAINRVFLEEEYNGYLDDTRYYLGLKKIADIVGSSKEALLPSMAVASLPNRLAANYKSSENYNRLEAKERIGQLLAQLEENQEFLLLQTPNSYAFSYMDAAYDIPVSNSSFLYETDTVPFVQIVLSGCVDMYAETNLVVRAGDSSVLELIDYNVYPQFTVTASGSSDLANTNSNSLFLPDFEDISEDIAAIYEEVNRVLSPVYGAMITDRQVVEENVAVSDYDNGWSVVVNYSDRDVTIGQITVTAKSAVSVQTELLQ